MNNVKQTHKPTYRSELREAQTALTRERIVEAAAQLLGEMGVAEGITFKAVAARARVTEMTVYRHFPTKDDLLQGLWRYLNAQMGPDIGMPRSAEELMAQHDALFAGFDRIALQIVASITTAQGREMRTSLNAPRKEAFLGIVDGIAPGLDIPTRTAAAASLQLLHSAYAWDSFREQWGLTGAEAGTATKWAIEALISHLRSLK